MFCTKNTKIQTNRSWRGKVWKRNSLPSKNSKLFKSMLEYGKHRTYKGRKRDRKYHYQYSYNVAEMCTSENIA